MAKYTAIADLLKKRIIHGDYAMKDIPPERELALEVDASRKTARRAVQHLIDNGLLVRQSNGRLAVNRATGGRDRTAPFQLAYLAPTTQSAEIQRTRIALDQVAEEMGARVRPILYLHWDDAQILDVFDGFDAVFLYPRPEPMPQWLIDRLRDGATPAVVFGVDMSHLGVRCVRLFPPVFVQKLLDHLKAKGHRSVDCLNTEFSPLNTMEQRIEQWQLWRMAHGIQGQLIHDPNGSPMNSYRTMMRLLKEGRFTATGLFCTTMAAAVGAMRAFHDCNYKVGRDVAICTVNSEGMAEYLVPSVTCLEMQDLRPYIRVVMEWMIHGDWVGSLLVQPQEVDLFIGESTVQDLHTLPREPVLKEPSRIDKGTDAVRTPAF